MEENRYGINWLSLFIKVIVFVVVVLLAIWLISKLTLKNKGLSFNENNKMFQDASVEYFKKNLPKDTEKKSVTLNQLINWKYLEKLKNEDGKICDARNSKSQIEVVEDYYSIKTILVCGNKSETSYIKLGNEDCSSCDIKEKGLKVVKKEEISTEAKEEDKENKDNASSNDTIIKQESSKGTTNSKDQSTTNNQSNATNNQTILHEYVKEKEEYSQWYTGKVTGNNIENSVRNISYSKYCKNEEYTYYTTGYVTKTMNYSYKLELKNLSNVNNLKLKNTSYFTSSNDYQSYLDNKFKDLEMVGSTTYYLPNANTIEKASLDKNNFTYTISKVYEENGKYYVNISVNVKNLNNANAYYLASIKEYIYYVPIKFTISYIDKGNCIVDKTDNSNNYNSYTIIDTWNEKTDIYRYKLITKEYKYSSSNTLEGYTKTGKTKLAG